MSLPPFIKKFNYIVHYWEDFCGGAPWFAYVKLAGPVVGKAVLAYVKPSDLQIGYTRWRRNVSRSEHHFRRRGKNRTYKSEWRRKAGRILDLLSDPSGTVGKALEDAVLLEPIAVAAGEQFIFRLSSYALVTLNWLFIAGLVEDAFYDWTTLVQRTFPDAGCLHGVKIQEDLSGTRYNCGFPPYNLFYLSGTVLKIHGPHPGLNGRTYIFATIYNRGDYDLENIGFEATQYKNGYIHWREQFGLLTIAAHNHATVMAAINWPGNVAPVNEEQRIAFFGTTGLCEYSDAFLWQVGREDL